MSGLMLSYGHPVGLRMTTSLRSFNNPHAVDSIAAGFSVTVASLIMFNTLVRRNDKSFVYIYWRP